VLGLGLALVVTGAAFYKPVQLSWLVASLGGFRLVRAWHFDAMCALLAFIPGHLVMVALHGWRNFASMWAGVRD
jgi:thiosulfate reductase cytochrome b subunit